MTNNRKKCLQVGFLLTSIGLTACSSWRAGSDDTNPYEGMTAKQLFDDSNTLLAKHEYSSAIKRLEAFDTMYPFDEHAERIQIKLVYAYYKNEEFPSAAAAAERFIHLYPRSSRVDYVMYLKALANARQNRGVYAKFLPMDESYRDPGTQLQAYQDFSQLVERFPHSAYRGKAVSQMTTLQNSFAKRDLNAATYYFERRLYVAAEARARLVVEKYPHSSSYQPALKIMYDSDLAMGLTKAANEVKAKLGKHE
jgi:outer membrane protein assembly factor BamD